MYKQKLSPEELEFKKQFKRRLGSPYRATTDQLNLSAGKEHNLCMLLEALITILNDEHYISEVFPNKELRESLENLLTKEQIEALFLKGKKKMFKHDFVNLKRERIKEFHHTSLNDVVKEIAKNKKSPIDVIDVKKYLKKYEPVLKMLMMIKNEKH